MVEPLFQSTTNGTTLSDELTTGGYAEYYASKLGWYVHPCHGFDAVGRCTCGREHTESKDKGKHPVTRWKETATIDPMTVAGWWQDNPYYNVAIWCKPSGFFVIDIDPRSGGDESFAILEENLEWSLPKTVEAITGVYTYQGRQVRGRHLYYKYDGTETLVGDLKAKLGLKGIDIKYDGYVLAPPSKHSSGVNYEWKPGHAPWDIWMADAPENLIEILKSKGGSSYRRTGVVTATDWSGIADYEFEGKKVDLEKLFTEGLDEGERAVQIYRMACAVANTVDVSTEVGRTMVETTMIRFNHEKVRPPLELEGPNGLMNHVQRAIEYIQNNPKTNFHAEVDEWALEAAKKMSDGSFRTGNMPSKSVERKSPSGASTEFDMYTAPGTVGGAVLASAEAGASAVEATRLTNMDVPKSQDALTEEDGGTPNKRSLSDLGNGRRIVDAFGSVIAYTSGLGWHTWAGNYWEFDSENLRLSELAKNIPSIISGEVVEYDESQRPEVHKWANVSRSSSKMDAALRQAKSDLRINVPVDLWDSDPYLLGVKNGVIDLRNGDLLSGRPELRITRRSPVDYVSGAYSKRWIDFIDYATRGDKELQEFIQRLCGYTITGLSHLDILPLVYGPSGSGKNTFVEAIVKALGTAQLSWPMDSNILAKDDGKSSPTDEYHWAALRARRMAWADELPDGERVKENAIKKLTGSSEISARSPGEKPFTFQSQAKLWITTNHKPIITDDAMWRRLVPIPWEAVPTTPDPSLKEYLFDPEGGLGAVLAWCVEGAVKFLDPTTGGLGFSKVVHEASEAYRRSEDRIGIFFNEETAEQTGGSTRLKDIFYLYQSWSEERGERPMTYIAFQRKVVERKDMLLEGEGTRAILMDRVIASRVPTSTSSDVMAAAGEVDYGKLLGGFR